MASAQIRTRALRRAGTSSWESLMLVSFLVFLSIRSMGWQTAHPASSTGMQAAKAPWHLAQRKEHVFPLLGIERFEDICVIAFRQVEDRA